MTEADGGRFVALLRGVNVGKAGRVAMADLRAFFGEQGLSEAATLLNSGNVVFRGAHGDDSAALAERLGTALAERFGISPAVVVVSARELAAIVDENRLAQYAENPSRLVVGFVNDPSVLEAVRPLLNADWGDERVALGSRAVYSWHPHGITAGRLAQAVGRALGDSVTSRNWATAVKLRDLASR
jgi:uncharacterized protein (DUF1697 family)